MTTASGDFAHAEGMAVDVKSGLVEYKLGGGASGMASKVEGFGCTASGKGSYAGGMLAEAADDVSFVWNGYKESLPDSQGIKDLLHGASTVDANAALAII